MKALSIRQPWAWLIVHGYKDIENRSWNTKFRGRVLIHAGKQPAVDLDDILEFCANLGIELPEFMYGGGIVGVATIVDVVAESNSPWFDHGSFGFVICDAKPVEFVECRGRLGFFDALEYDVEMLKRGEGENEASENGR